jgi:PAS domain S-box-containing protein
MGTTGVHEKSGESRYREYHPLILVLSVVAVVFLAIYVNMFLGIEVVYTHLFYIPIILAGVWYHRKAVYLAMSLGVLHIVLSYISDGSLTYEPFLRAFLFLIIGYVVGTIAARKDNLCDGLKRTEHDLRRMQATLEKQVQERTQELSEINESLKREINERNKAENSLMLARFSIDKAADFIAWINPDGSFHYVNDALCKATGYTREQLLAMKAWEIEPDSPDDQWPGQWKLLKESGSWHTESVLRTREGQVIPVTIMNNYLQFRGREYNCAYIRDITKRKLAEDALKKSRAILARAQSIAHVGNWAWNLKTGQIQWSDEVYRIFGYDPGGIQPTEAMLISSVYPEDREIAARAFAGAAHDNTLFNIDYRIVARDGTTRYVNFVADKLARDKAGNPAWVYGIIQDITARKLTEAALQDAKAQAELYLDLMSHDINNMNQIGIGFLEMALDRLKGLSDESKSLLIKPLEALESSTRLIKNVGKLQRAREGDLRITRVNVGEVVRELLPKCSTMAGRDIRVNYRGNDCFVMANELLTDVFSNIIGNAIKHSQGPLVIDIDVKKVREDGNDYCVISVEDNGPGIPDSLKVRLFTRFQRGATKASGRGLGLYLVKTLVDDYHGKVWVEDRVPGDYKQGTRFVVRLMGVE